MMAGGPAASEGGGPGLGRGPEEDGARALATGAREPAASTSRLPLGCFEVLSGKEGRTWVESRTGGRFAERRV